MGAVVAELKVVSKHATRVAVVHGGGVVRRQVGDLSIGTGGAGGKAQQAVVARIENPAVAAGIQCQRSALTAVALEAQLVRGHHRAAGIAACAADHVAGRTALVTVHIKVAQLLVAAAIGNPDTAVVVASLFCAQRQWR